MVTKSIIPLSVLGIDIDRHMSPGYGLPNRARVHYNLGLLLQHLKQDSNAETSLLKAQELEPDNLDYLYALADFYLKRNKLQQARSIAKEMVARHPNHRIGRDILNLIEKNMEIRSN